MLRILSVAAAIALLPGLCLAGPCEPGWSSGYPAPKKFSGGAAAYYDGMIYVTTGELEYDGFQKAMWIYDVADDTWEIGENYDAAGWTGACAVFYNSRAYFFGGVRGPTYVDYTAVYNTATGGWSAGAAMPRESAGHYCALINGVAYLAGGENSLGDRSDLIAYDVESDTWYEGLSALPGPRSYGVGATDGDLFYIYGSASDAAAFSYDPDEDAWSALPDMIEQRRSPAGAYAEGFLYAFAGRNAEVVGSNERFDVANNAWSTFSPSMPTPVSAAAAAYVPEFGKSFIVLGGVKNSTPYSKAQILSFCRVDLLDMDPKTGRNDQDVEVTISGWGFEAADIAYLDDGLKTRIDLTGLDVTDQTTITAFVPAGSPAGIYDLTVQSESGEADTLEDAYQVTAWSDDDDDDDDSERGDDDDDGACCG